MSPLASTARSRRPKACARATVSLRRRRRSAPPLAMSTRRTFRRATTSRRRNRSPSCACRTTGARELALVRWGLIPGWVKDPRTFTTLINARSETRAREAVVPGGIRHRRCLVPADGFYEWTGAAGMKRPHLIRPRAGGPLAFAGIWDHWLGADGSEIDSMAILTVAANATVSRPCTTACRRSCSRPISRPGWTRAACSRMPRRGLLRPAPGRPAGGHRGRPPTQQSARRGGRAAAARGDPDAALTLYQGRAKSLACLLKRPERPRSAMEIDQDPWSDHDMPRKRRGGTLLCRCQDPAPCRVMAANSRLAPLPTRADAHGAAERAAAQIRPDRDAGWQ